ncbi:helix-turn-helix domain-containing protein [Anaerosinus massiliensis]|uniref:helix-turn-helix domain-containing protein n=1 Tax=Massilibacillus massiliensis TaxID=1806837 RepID=UPI000DA63F96|nr:helix-turn-helix transcriptional regulator [Massilibacillus massiliensis]
MKVYQRIKQYMDDKGIKQNHVALKAGFNPKTFNAIFHERRKLTVDEFENVCVLGLGVNPKYFFENIVLDSKNEIKTTA